MPSVESGDSTFVVFVVVRPTIVFHIGFASLANGRAGLVVSLVSELVLPSAVANHRPADVETTVDVGC